MTPQQALVNTPKLKSHVYVIPLPSGGVDIRDNGESIILEKPDVVKTLFGILPLFDGKHDHKQICASQGEGKVELVAQLLAFMSRKNLLEDALPYCSENNLPYKNQLHLFSHCCDNSAWALETLFQAKIAVIGLGTVGAMVLESLAASGLKNIHLADSNKVAPHDLCCKDIFTRHDLGEYKVQVAKKYFTARYPGINITCHTDPIQSKASIQCIVKDMDLAAVCMDGMVHNLYHMVNEACHASGTPWLRIALENHEGIAGPIVVPGETACFQCLEMRTKANHNTLERQIVLENYIDTHPDHHACFGYLPSYAGIIAQTGTLEIIKLLTGFVPPAALGRMFVIDFTTLETQFHHVLKIPRCPVCKRKQPAKRAWEIHG